MKIDKSRTKTLSTIQLQMLRACFCLVIFCTPSFAADYSNFEAEIRSVIEVQLDAFSRGDATTAYSQASPTIRNLFPTETIFMMMVRSGYAALIAPRRVDFLELFDNQGSPIYRVSIESSDGQQWMAFYRMEAQADRSWRIAGCVLMAMSGQSV